MDYYFNLYLLSKTVVNILIEILLANENRTFSAKQSKAMKKLFHLIKNAFVNMNFLPFFIFLHVNKQMHFYQVEFLFSFENG